MKTLRSIGLLLLVYTTAYAGGGNPNDKLMPINLPTVLKLAGANNLTIKQYGLLYHLSQSEIDKADEWYLPTIYLGPELHYLNGAVMNTNGTILTDITQKELWLGGGVGAVWDFSDGIYNVMAKKQQSLAMQEEGQAQRNNVILKAISTYYDLLTAQFKYNQLQSLLTQADTISQQIKVQVDAGIRYQSEYLLAQSSYSHIKIELSNARVDMLQQSNILLSVLNIDTNALLVSLDTSVAPLDLMKNITDTSMSAYGEYVKNRPEYKSMEAELNAIQDEKKTTTVGLLMPKLYLGSTPDGVLGAFGSPYNSTYRVDGELLWSIPLGRLIYKGDLKIYNDNINIEQNNIAQLTNQVRLDVKNAREQIVLALEQTKIANTGLQASKNALTQSVEREALGTVRPFEVFQSEQFYVQAELDYLKSISDYNKAQYALYVATGNNL